jgi:hypothetical protein
MSLYTETEDAFICDHWRTMTDAQIADALGRPETGVGSHRLKLGLLRAVKGPKSNGTRRWSKSDDETLRELYTAGVSDPEIATALGRTPGAVGQRRSSLGLVARTAESNSNGWEGEEDRVLTFLFNRGLTDSQIGRALGRTACAIKDRRQSLGLWREPRQ